MIAIIFIILCVIAWFFAASIAAIRFMDIGINDAAAIMLSALCIVALAWLIHSEIEDEKRNPCAEYETRMQFNAVTKTMMPMRVCVLRGEWVTDGVEP